MSSVERSQGVAAAASAAVVAGVGDNPGAKKRRRWSTVQEGAVVAPNRFGGKKQQLKILGRQHQHHHNPSSSFNSLASFQSKSNPIFEPSAPSEGSNDPEVLGEGEGEGLRQGAARRFPSSKWSKAFSGATLPTTAAAAIAGMSKGGGGGELQQLHPGARKLLVPKKKTSTQCSLVSITGNRSWGLEDDGMENSQQPLLLSPTRNEAYWELEETKESKEISYDCSEGKWQQHQDEEGPNKGSDGLLLPISRVVSPVRTSSDDGAQSIDGPHFLDDVLPDEREELATFESCERRARELMEKVQANADADLAQLKAHKAMIDLLRADCTRHEAAAKQYADLHRDAVVQLMSVRDEKRELELEREGEAIAKEELKQRLEKLEREVQDAGTITEKPKLGTSMEKELEEDAWRKKVEALEIELIAVKSDRDALTVALEDARKDAQLRVSDTEEREVGSEAGLESAEQVLSFDRLAELQAQLAALCDEMDKLQRERNELRLAVLDGEKKVQEARSERDAVVHAVKNEWDSVKVAFREDKEKLKRELEAVREQKAKLESALHATANNSGFSEQHESRRLDADPIAMLEAVQSCWVSRGRDLQSKKVPGSEGSSGTPNKGAVTGDLNFAEGVRGRSEDGPGALQTAVSEQRIEAESMRDENKKLETELIEVREHIRELEGERETLFAALTGVRDGNKKLEGELSDVQDERTKLEKEREALIAVQEERLKLEAERAVVFKAMRGENQKLESEREVLIAMQAYLKKLEVKKDLVQTLGGDEKRRRKSTQDIETENVKMIDVK